MTVQSVAPAGPGKLGRILGLVAGPRQQQMVVTTVPARRRRRLPMPLMLAVGVVTVSVLLVVAVVRVCWVTIAGRYRDVARPVWVSVTVAVAGTWATRAGHTGLLTGGLLLLAAVAGWAPWDRGYKWWPARGLPQIPVRRTWLDRPIERMFAGTAAAAAAGWVLLLAAVSWCPPVAGAWVALTSFWWAPWLRHYSWWRRKGAGSPVARLWAEDVVPLGGLSAGSQLVKVQDRGDVCEAIILGRLGVTPAQLVATMGQVASAMDAVPGSLRITADRDLHGPRVRLVLTAGRPLQERTFPWPGPSLTHDGWIDVGPTSAGVVLRARYRAPGDGAKHFLISGATGAGKSGFTRILILEAGLDPDSCIVYADGKYGQSAPCIHDAVDVLALTDTAIVRAISGVYRVLRRRQVRLARRGQSCWDPAPGEPDLLLFLGEASVIWEIDPRLVGIVHKIAKLGRSLGIHLVEDVQDAMGDEVGSTKIRNQLLGGGTGWAGAAGGGMASRLTTQGEDVDLTKLPGVPGSAYLLGKAIGEQPRVPIRTFQVTDEIGREWAAKAVHPNLCVQDAAALDVAWFAEHRDDMDDDAEEEDLDDEDRDDAVDDDAALIVGAPHRIDVADLLADETAGIARVRAVLVQAAPAALQRKEIAEKTKLVPRHVTDLLNRLEADGKAERTTDSKWRAAA